MSENTTILGTDPFATLKKLSGSVGTLRIMVKAFDELWRHNPEGFENIVSKSVPAWKGHESIPIALRVIISESDKPEIRRIVYEVCQRPKIDPLERISLIMVCAMWGDDSAKRYVLDYCQKEIEKASKPNSSRFCAAYSALRREAMLGYFRDEVSLRALLSQIDSVRDQMNECRGFAEALLEFNVGGFRQLQERLVKVLQGKGKASNTDISSCFALAATRERKYAELLLEVFKGMRRNDFWSQGLRHHALIGFAYCEPDVGKLQKTIEGLLIEKVPEYCRWSLFNPPAIVAEWMLVCSVLWNYEIDSPTIRDALYKISSGSSKKAAQFATALMILRGDTLREKMRFSAEDVDVKCDVDFLQYDMNLNFSYYRRCHGPAWANP